MGRRHARHAIEDMLGAIEGITHAVAGKGFDAYRSDWLLSHGVERGIEIISEASRSIGEGVQSIRPDVPWQKIRTIGNILRHEYHDLSDTVIWGVVVDELPALRIALEDILQALPIGEGHDAADLVE